MRFFFRARERRKRELAEEIRTHFEMAVKDRMARGESRKDAERAARLEFGSVDLVKEDARAAWGGMWIDRFERDFRFALRALRKRPGFALSTILILALGIGATTAIFSVVNGVLIQPLPYPDSDRLIELRHQKLDDDDIAASTALYFTYREHNETFDSLALWTSGPAVVTGIQQSVEVQSLNVTHEFLQTLGVRPALGRGFSEADGQPGAPLAVVLSDAFWDRHLGGTEDAIGQSLVVEGEAYSIVGVLPASFRFLTEQVEILTPMQPAPGDGGTAMFGSFGERGIARLKPGVTLAEASADIARMVPIARETFPPFGGNARADLNEFGPNLRFLKETVVGELDDVLWILMGTIGVLFLIACANVANLQMMRTDARLEELSIRAALGARLGAIARSLLTETMLLGIAGGAVGLLVAAVALPFLLSAAGEYLPSVLEISIDRTVLVFALIASVVCGTVLGLVPLMKYGVPGLTSVLREGGRSHSQTRERHRARHLLVTSQVALALVLLVAAGLMMRTFQSLRSVDPGFDPSAQVQTLTIPTGFVPDFSRAVRLLRDVQARLSELPGVQSAAFVSVVPLAGIGPNTGALVEEEPGVENLATFEFRFVSPGFFETIGTRHIAGRALSWNDVYDEDRPEVVIVSESFAQAQFGSAEAAIGKRMRRTPESEWIEIAGVVGDIHVEAIDQPLPETVYFTQRNEVAQYVGRTVTFVIRSGRVGTPGFLEELQRVIWSVDSSLPLADSRTLNDLYRQSMARTSLALVLLAIMSIMALGLSLVGIYGVIGYLLSKRMREIGVRIALGAQYAGLRRLLLGQVLVPVVVGVVLGLGMAAALARVAQSLLFGVTALDPATYAVVALTLLTTAAIAGYIPTRRVVRVDPTEALRVE